MLTTQRLLLRPWQSTDRAPFARMNADAQVRRYFPGMLTRAASDASVDRFEAHYLEHGITFLAAELLQTGAFIGFIGMIYPDKEVPLPAGSLEAGWRLAPAYWGRGLATEGAAACISYAFGELTVPAVGAITTVTNQPSRRVMEKVGMTYLEEFLHPGIDPQSSVALHVAYVRWRGRRPEGR